MKRLSLVLLLLLSALLSFSCTADHHGPDATTCQSALVQNLIKTACVETGTPGVSVHVIHPSYGDLAFVWGVSDLETQTPVKPGDLFRVGSLTKSFTGAAIVRLAQDGLLELDRPVSDYLGLDYAPLSAISVRQLLNMSSGLAEYLGGSFLTGSVLPDPLRAYQPADLLDAAFGAAAEPLFVPGSDWAYNNTNYVLLGLLIETLSGLSYRDYLQQELIGPLGLEDTIVLRDATIPPGLVRGYYDYDEDGSYEDWTAMNMSYVWSAGCLAATARDIAGWMRAVATGSVAQPAFRPDLFEGQTIDQGVVYGAGIVTDADFGIGHNGTVIGYHADVWHESGITVAVLCNTNAPLHDDGRDPTREIAQGILAILK